MGVKNRMAAYTLSGLATRYYDFKQGSRLPKLSNKKPFIKTIEDNVDHIEDSGVWSYKRMNPALADHMAAEWTGSLQIPKSGNYTFYLDSDDGSMLWIDQSAVVDRGVVVNNDGLHGLRE